jgi:hypothetical protein
MELIGCNPVAGAPPEGGRSLRTCSRPFVVLSAIGIIIGVAASSDIGRGIAGSMMLILSIALYLIGVKNRSLRRVLFLALILRLGLVMVGHYIALPDSSVDAVNFERLGWEAAQAWRSGEEPPNVTKAYLYSGIIGVLYFVFGRYVIIPLLLNVALGLVVVNMVWHLVLNAGGTHSQAVKAAAIAALFPTLNLYSAVLMRENVIACSLALSVYWFMRWLKGYGWRYAIWAGIALVVSGILHGGVLIVGFVYGAFLWFYDPKRKAFSVVHTGALLAVGFAIAFVCIISTSLVSKLPANLGDVVSADYAQDTVTTAARSRAAYLVGFVPRSLVDIVVQTPVRVLYFLFSPFPWMLSNVSDAVGMIDAFLYLLLGMGALRALWSVKRENRPFIWLLALSIIMIVIVFSWGTSNYGAAIRHRQKASWLLIALAGIGLPKFRCVTAGCKIPH